MSPEADLTLSALRAYGDAIVDCLLLENANRWRSLGPADQRQVESLAREVAARLLEEPARRIEAAGPAQARAVAELFALDQPRSAAAPESRLTRVSS